MNPITEQLKLQLSLIKANFLSGSEPFFTFSKYDFKLAQVVMSKHILLHAILNALHKPKFHTAQTHPQILKLY